MITSLSVGDFFWGEIDETRISFRYKDMPGDVHFTISWKNENNINLHITKNIGDGNRKPKIDIVRWDKDLVDKFLPYVPALVIGNFYSPISLKKYPRSSRRNIRLIFFDELESHPVYKTLGDDASVIIKKHSVIRRKKKMSIKPSVEKEIIHFFKSKGVNSIFLNNLRSLKVNSFESSDSRCGIIFLGKRMNHFVAHKNKCYILNRNKSLNAFLKVFMKPELVDGITKKIADALIQIQDAKTYEDTLPYNKPYQLYLES